MMDGGVVQDDDGTLAREGFGVRQLRASKSVGESRRRRPPQQRRGQQGWRWYTALTTVALNASRKRVLLKVPLVMYQFTKPLTSKPHRAEWRRPRPIMPDECIGVLPRIAHPKFRLMARGSLAVSSRKKSCSGENVDTMYALNLRAARSSRSRAYPRRRLHEKPRR